MSANASLLRGYPRCVQKYSQDSKLLWKTTIGRQRPMHSDEVWMPQKSSFHELMQNINTWYYEVFLKTLFHINFLITISWQIIIFGNSIWSPHSLCGESLGQGGQNGWAVQLYLECIHPLWCWIHTWCSYLLSIMRLFIFLIMSSYPVGQ